MCSHETQSPSPQEEAMKLWSAVLRAIVAEFFDCIGDVDPCSDFGCTAIAWHLLFAAHRLPRPVIPNNGSACSQLN